MHSVFYLLRSGLVPSCPAVGLASGKAAVFNATLESLPEQLREEVNDHVHSSTLYLCQRNRRPHVLFLPLYYVLLVLHTKALFIHSFAQILPECQALS